MRAAPIRQLRSLLSPQIYRNPLIVARKVSTKNDLEPPKDAKWTAVYRYRRILLCQIVSKSKLIVTGATVILLPYAYNEHSLGTHGDVWFYACCSLAIATPLLLAIINRYLNRLVGVVSMTDDSKWVRFGYLTPSGSRKDLIVPIEDLLPASEAGYSEGDDFVKWRISLYADEGLRNSR